MTRPKPHERVALKRAFPDFNLRSGDVGVVVEVLTPNDLLVEFMDSEGDTVALLDLDDSDVRSLSEADLKQHQHAASLPAGTEPYVAAARRAAPSQQAKQRRR